jgi:hypothetical protein
MLSTSNQFSVLDDNPPESLDPTENPQPIHTSTPTRRRTKNHNKTAPLHIVNVNFQSVKTKQGERLNLIDSVKPDIIFGTETWID